jgi:hypothetical protein
MSFCDCIKVDLIVDGEFVSLNLFPTGEIIGGADQFSAEIGETELFIEYDSQNERWIMYVGDDPFFAFFESTNEACPFGIWAVVVGQGNPTFAETMECGPIVCVPIEDRTKREYKSIRLPKQFVEQKRGFDECCSCPPMLVLASNDNESWKNDVTSAWIKLSDQIDTVQFVLEKNGQPTNIVLVPVVFPNEPFAFHTTIKWINVLNSHGVGCYTLKINFNISGINGSLIWGVYDLKPFSIENALKTARIRVKYNLKHEIEGINFTGANVEDSFRFNGFIGRRQPNMEIDNLIYQNREMRTVVRENLNQWSIETDPLEECKISKLTDLILLSENEMWISDHNAHNHSYKILDIPTVVDESPEIDYLDKFQRRAILTCLVGDRNKNKRTYFK